MNLTVEEFVAKLSSSDPVPGGGTAAAVTGAVAASLVAMVGRVTLGKQKYEAVWDLMEKTVSRADELSARLLELGREDEESFRKLMAALGLKKDTPEEKEYSNKELAKANLKVTEIPLETARACKEVAGLAAVVLESGNRNAQSDAQTALFLSSAAFRGAEATARINFPGLSEAHQVQYEKELNRLKAGLAELNKKAGG